jgi:hypothetical protein
MSKDIFIPSILFVLGCLFTLMALPAMAVSLVVGFLILGANFIKKGRADSSSRLMAKSGLALVIGPILTFVLVFLGMSGYFGA